MDEYTLFRRVREERSTLAAAVYAASAGAQQLMVRRLFCCGTG
jgi:hypothetical protein